MRQLVESVLGPKAFAVRGIIFSKLPGANWKVPWHQDWTIAVRERRGAPGGGPWWVSNLGTQMVKHTHRIYVPGHGLFVSDALKYA